MSSSAFALTFVICFMHTCAGKLALPRVSLEAFSPRGFSASIPDIEGITLFGFHGSLLPTRSPQVGTWARDVTKPTDGRWTYTNPDAELNVGDKMYFWTYVIYDGAGYRNEYAEWTVMRHIDGFTGDIDGFTDGFSETIPSRSASGPEDDNGMVVQETPDKKNQAFKPSTPSSIDDDDFGKQETTLPLKPSTQNPIQAVTPSSKNTQNQPLILDPVPSCRQTASEVRNMKRICSGQLLFASDFKTLSTIDEMWKPEVEFGDEPDYPFVVYLNGTHISLENGHLSIKPIFLEEIYGKGIERKMLKLEGCTGESKIRCKREGVGAQILPPIVSGKITTKDTFNFRYGRVEVRAKLSKGNWILSDILMEPSENKYGSANYISGIMKIASGRGNAKYDKVLVGGVIINKELRHRNHSLKVHQHQDSLTNDFHNFTLVWETDIISLYVDGENYGDIGGDAESFYEYGLRNNIVDADKWDKDGTKIAPFDEMFFISLGIRAGGIFDFEEDKTKPWMSMSSKGLVEFWKSRDKWEPTWSNAGMQVESVRVYAL